MAFEYKRRGKKNLDDNFPSQSPRESGNGRSRGRSRNDEGIGFSPARGFTGPRDEPPVDRPPVSRPPKEVIQDTEPTSRYFNITEIPSYLGEGKNTIRLMGSVQLKKNSQIQIEILDAKANPIYFEIPNKKQKDGSRLISIWV